MDEDTKKAIADAVAEALAAQKVEHDEAVKGLKAKNAELIAAQKTAKQAADEAEQARLDAEAAAAANSTDIETVKKAHAKELEKLQTKLNSLTEERNRDKIEAAVAAQLAEMGVAKGFVGMVKRDLMGRAKIENNEVTIDGTAIGDFVSEWKASDEGKSVIEAPLTTGAGATGSTAKGDDWAGPPKGAEEQHRFMKLAAENPAEANRLADKWGTPQLKV